MQIRKGSTYIQQRMRSEHNDLSEKVTKTHMNALKMLKFQKNKINLQILYITQRIQYNNQQDINITTNFQTININQIIYINNIIHIKKYQIKFKSDFRLSWRCL